MWLRVLVLAIAAGGQPQVPGAPHQEYYAASNPCYDERGAAQRCVPDFINAAYNREVFVTNTCGTRGPSRYCVQTGHSGMQKSCELCDDAVRELRHPARHLTDLNVPPNETWWQSETMLDGVQHPAVVNLTLHLGKTFDITYIRLKFHSPRPESFAIYKKTREGDEWRAWQYYSASCRSTYDVPDAGAVLPGAEDAALCSREFSDISPISGGDVVFSTLEGRPSADRFEESDTLQEWVTASSIRVVLSRLNTFGDEVFRDEKVLQSYYYAISDFAVGGRCRCNGHASECVKSTGGGVERMLCACEHNTAGDDCDRCKEFFNDRPWQAASVSDAHECRECACNGLASRCEFDPALYALTGHGGRCLACQGNTRGTHCELCAEHHWRRPGERHCVPCDCDEDGSESLQCAVDSGQCACKPGVGGLRCDVCLPGHYAFTSAGCRSCGCHEAGSAGPGLPRCDAAAGDCACKPLVEGRQCDRCPPGHFNLDAANEFGCTRCFCFGHFESCDSADGYTARNISSDFDKGRLGWLAEAGGQVGLSERDAAIAVGDAGEGRRAYFVAPPAYLGDQRASYNQLLQFTLRITTREPRDYADDVVLLGANGQKMWTQIFAQDNPQPATFEQTYSFRLHEDPRFRWNPRMTAMDMLSILANVTALKVRATYQSADVGYLSNVRLVSAARGAGGEPVGWVEQCQCLPGHAGQFCQHCAAGFKRSAKLGGPYSRCIPCECHGHAAECDAESGKCACEHHTDGDTCERCARGFFGDALAGTADGCQPCPCPNGTACTLLHDGQPFCTECPEGYTGRYCDACNDGYYGEPGAGAPCRLCECSGNIDANAIGNCDQRTGECTKCIHHTAGAHCERCQPGYWGDALLDAKGDCRPCGCYAPGTAKPSADYDVLECGQEDGQCACLPHVAGLRCDTCEPGYFNITSGGGCQPCACDPLGSLDSACDLRSGQCRCKPGVTGTRCDRCAPRHFGFGADAGCAACDCEPAGSTGADCEPAGGQCRCRPNAAGRRCDACAENMFDLAAGCRPCGECYTLIQQRVAAHRGRVAQLDELLKEIRDNPVTVNDTNFDNQLEAAKRAIGELAADVTSGLDSDDSDLVGRLRRLREDLAAAERLVETVADVIGQARQAAGQTAATLDGWQQTKESLYGDVDRVRSLLATDAVEAWGAARAAADKYGAQSRQLTDLAAESRRLAAQHETAAAQIEQTGRQAANVSSRALQNAKEAIFGGEQVSREIEKLKRRFADGEQLHNETALLAEQQVEAAGRAVQAAADAFAQVEALQLPPDDDSQLGAKADALRLEARRTEQRALDERAGNAQAAREADVALLQAKHALEQVLAMQQQADSILADLDAVRAKAAAAKQTAEHTLEEAQRTLATLASFDRLVEQSRQQAAEQLRGVGQVQADLEEARARTADAERELGSAAADAQNAQSIAAEAQRVAEEASQQARATRQRAAATKDSAGNMKAEAEELRAAVANELDTIANYETQAAKDRQTASEAVGAATQAERAAERANETVTAAVARVKQVVDKLRNVDEVTDGELDALERQLDEAERALADADLEAKVERLKAAQAEQQLTINEYERQIDALGREVANVEAIRDSLPTRCFNVIKLEEGTQL